MKRNAIEERFQRSGHAIEHSENKINNEAVEIRNILAAAEIMNISISIRHKRVNMHLKAKSV